MSFNTNWDVDNYRTEFECDEHWELRRSFMVKHKDKFPEDRLVCLAQVFTNVEFLGCRYPTKTMELVAELSEGVADAFREKQKSKLQRTFVKASDAAGAKVKGLKRPALAGSSDSPPKIPKRADNFQQPQNFVPSLDDGLASNLKNTSDSVDKPPINISNDNGSSESTQDLKICPSTKATESPVVENEEKNKEPNVFNVNGNEQNSKFFLQAPFEEQQNSGKAGAKINSSAARKQRKGIARVERCTHLDSEIEILNTGKYGRLVLIEHMPFAGPYNVLVSSTTLCKIPFRIEYGNENKKCCKIIVNDRVVVSVSDASKKIARDVAISCALEKLKDVCYTLKVKKQRVPDDLIVEHSMISSLAPSSAAHSENHAPIPKAVSLATPLPEDNIGSKLMKSMGWTGGGLGKAEQGIQEPVSVSLRNDRAGLGAQKTRVDAIFKTKARNYLMSYLAQNFPPNLLLKADEFSALERDAVHQIAKALGLQSIAIGKNDDAYLKISRKNSVYVIAAQMLRQGVFSDEYHELVVPRNPSSIHSEPECLNASDFPHLCHQSSVGQIEDEKSWPKPTVSDALVGDIWKLLEAYKVEHKEPRKHDRRRLKLLKKRVEKKKVKPNKQSPPKQYSLEAIAAGPYGSFFLIEYENGYDHVTRVMVESEQNNFVRIKYQHGKYKAES